MMQRLENTNILDIYPLTPMQEGVYFHFLYDRFSPAFFVQLNYKIQGRIQPDLVKDSMEALIERHDVLRTVFNHEKTGKPLQVVLKQGNSDISYLDFSREWPEERKNLHLQEFREQDKRKVFDLNKDVLMRLTVIRLEQELFEFVWSFHHILMDGWCINTLVSEYNVIYESRKNEKEVKLPPVKPFREYIHWLKQQDQEASKRYWREYLAGYTGIATLPSFKAPAREGIFDNAQFVVRFDKHTIQSLKEISRSLGVTISLIMQAVWGLVLGRYKGDYDAVFGVVVSGRPADLADAESMIGLFINTIPVRVSFNNMPFSALLIKLQQESLQNTLHCHTPLADIQSDTGLGRDLLNHAMVFENFPDMAQHINANTGKKTQGKQPIQVMSAIAFEQSNYDLDLRIGFGEQEGFFGLKYNRYAYSDEMISGVGNFLQILIERICADVHSGCKDLLSITPDEKVFLDAAGLHSVDFPAHMTAVSIIEERVKEFPDKKAVVCQGTALTYHELSLTSNTIAYLVSSCAIGQEGLVGLLLARGIEMAQSILGTWKAGAAYLPLDTEQPLDRIRWMISDSGIRMLITDSKNLKKAQQLQWICPLLETIFCIDANSFYSVPEDANESMGQELWEYIGQTAVDDITGGGWINSYTGLPFSRAEMDEYVSNTVSKLTPYLSPSVKVLEIGCASGLTMFAIAPGVDKYVGIDLSRQIISRNKKIAADMGLNHVELYQMYAHEIHLLDKTGFDVIIINSVAQNFNGHNYLRGVISKCISLLGPQGLIFWGDIMDLDQKDTFIASLRAFAEEHRNDAFQTKLDWSEELFIPQAFFDDLPALFPSIQKVQHSTKLHTLDNELTRFRYDTLLFVNKNASSPPIKPRKKQLDRSHLKEFSLQPPIDLSHPDGLSYIIYTSGSTGNPKGAMVEHIGMLNHLYAKINSLSAGPHSRILQNASATFDISVWQFFSALLTGGTTFVYPQDLVLNISTTLEKLAQDKITIAEFVPSYLDVLIEECGRSVTPLPDLAFLLVTGEALSVELTRRWFSIFPHIPIVNAYGPTEASDDITHHLMTQPPERAKVPLGKPVQNMQILILDKEMNLCPAGVKGEICVTGVGVGRGYLNNEDRTRLAFIDNSFDPTSPYKIYKTGDSGCWLPDGTIEFFGREDHQVKIRGFRIELGEIECRLQETPGVKNAVVIDRLDNTGNKYLAAYVCCGENSQLTQEDLRLSLLHKLPDYMVPTHFIVLDHMPLTPNGKIDRKNLPDPLTTLDQTTYDRRGSETEEKLIRIWEQVLDKRPIGLQDNFFRIGGHSLKATRVATGILKEMKIKIDLRQIFTHPTIAALAACIEQQQTSTIEEITPCPVLDYYPVSHSQKRMWLLSQFREASLAYNVFNSWTLRGDIRVDLLEQAVQILVQRHEILRTTFLMVNTEPEQVIHPAGHFVDAFQFLDLSSLEDPKQHMQEWLETIGNETFDLEAGPLFQLYLIRQDRQEYFCLLKMHHIICDGWSMQVIFNELTTFYSSLVTGKYTTPQPLKIHYKDFAYWQTKQLEKGVLARHRNYWHTVLKGPLPSLKLPSFLPRPQLQTYNGNSHIHQFSRSASTEIRKLSENNGASLFMTLVALINTLFYRYSGQDDIILGTSVAGRFLRELEEQVGFYINTLALRSRFSGSDSFNKLLSGTKEHMLNAFEHQQYPFDLIVDELSLERDLTRSAIFDVLVEFQNYSHTVSNGTSEKKETGFSITPQDQTRIRSIFDLNLEFREDQDDLILSITYNTDIYQDSQIRKMAIHLENLMRSVCHNPGIQLSRFEFMDTSEKTELLAYNPPPSGTTAQETVFTTFARQAGVSPDMPAVKDSAGVKTYQELTVNARQIAGLIHRIGTPAHNIGLLMDRSSLTIESILGIWQSGGAYLPLDPDTTVTHLRKMVAFSRISILFTTRAYIHLANELQWSCPHLRSIVCLDSNDIYLEKEPVLESMNKEMWEMVGEKAEDDIMGGGWINSYTGKPFSRLEMDEYADNTYNKLKPFLNKDTRVLEIGCASGITLFKVAPETAFYLGTDLSATILQKNQTLATARELPHVSFKCLYAHEIDQLEEEAFDIIVINSVIQNFSGTNYLRDVLTKCIAKLDGKGIIYVGDIMDISTRDELLADIAGALDFTDHRFYAREYFDDLRAAFPAIREVVHSDKSGTIQNELTRFRFDTILHVDKSCTLAVSGPDKLQMDRRHLDIADTSPINHSLPDGLAFLTLTPEGSDTFREVRTTQRQLLDQLLALNDVMHMTKDTSLLQNADYDQGSSIWQFFAPLTIGGMISIDDSNGHFNADSFLKRLLIDKIQIAQTTPGYLSLLLDEVLLRPVLLPDLKMLCLTGDVLHAHLVQHWYALYPEITLVNLYSCKLLSGAICHYAVDQPYTANRPPFDHTIPIGIPFNNVRVYIVNEAMQLCPEGVIGEICIGGEDGTMLSQTGDLGRWLPGGILSFHGKKTHQVIVKGQRISLSEVEAGLSRIDGVKFAAIKELGIRGGDKFLVAYISLFRRHEETDVAKIRRQLKSILPEYMMPDEICLLDTLPFDKHGSIDRSALPDIQNDKRIRTAEAPRSLMEQQLAAIWEDILNRRPIGIYDNFFAMGGHSLKATRVVSRVRKELFIKLELTQIFTAPTLAQLSDVLARSSRTKFNKIEPAPIQPDYALSHAQQRIWVLDRIDPGLVAYNIPSAYILTGELNTWALEQSFRWMVWRHEILRTSFILKDGEPRQVIHPAEQSGFYVKYTDLRGRTDAMEEARQIYRNERLTSFDLEQSPLLRVQLLQLEEFQFVLLYTIHHIISDGWSMDLIVKELLRNYQQLLADPDWSPIALPIHYKDYSEWQNAELQGESTKLDKEYWLNKFKETPTVLDMPSACLRPAIRSYAGDTRQFVLPTHLTVRLKQLSQEHGVSTYIMLVSIVNLLLYRYTGQKDIILSTPVAGRDHSDLDDQIGFYVNSLVLRTFVDGAWPFHIYLENVKQEVLQSFGHQFYPFDLLVEQLELPRDLSRSPLFDAMVTYWEYNGVKTQTNDPVRIEPFIAGSNVSKLDLTFHFMEKANNLGVDIEYCTAIFDSGTMDRMATHLLNLINAICLSPDQTIGNIPFLSEEETRCLQITCNRLDIAFPDNKLIHQYVEEWALRMPEAPAIHSPSDISTYAALNDAAGKMANFLYAQGIRQGDRVGVAMDWSERLISTFLAVLKTGAVCVPINPGLTADRIQYVIKDAALSFLLIRSADKRWDANWHIRTIPMEEELFQSYPVSTPVLPGSPGHTAFIIYDLSSRQTPSGITFSHTSLIRLLANEESLRIGRPTDRWLLLHANDLDIPVWQALTPFFGGGSLLIPQTNRSQLPSTIADLILDNDITMLHLAPGMFYPFLQQTLHETQRPVHSLRYIFFEPEALRPLLLEQWLDTYGDSRLMQLYAPAGVPIPATSRNIDREMIRKGEVNLGLPKAGREVLVLSEERQAMPFGSIGEIAVRYRPDDHWHMTGDLGRQLPGGEIIFIGRKDAQINIRGYRVRYEEIERALRRAGATEAAVLAIDHANGTERSLVAYLTDISEDDLAQLKKELSNSLPGHMIPEFFMIMGSLPLNAQGSIDYSRLPHPAWEEEPAAASLQPLSGMEQQIAAVWQESLGLQKIGRKDNFFELGGHSLKAVRIISSISKTFHAPLSLRDIFLHPTIEKLARIVDERAGSYQEQLILPAPPKDHYPVSHAQKRLWVLSQFEEASIAYNMPYTMTVEGTLDTLILNRSIYTIMQRHEILRTTFDLVDDELRQFIHPEPFPIFEQHDLRMAYDPEAMGEIMVKGNSRRSFDLKNGPLLRVLLIHLTDRKYIFMVNMHHIISDGWSMEIFGNEIFSLYNAYIRGQVNPLQPLSIQYKDYSEWQYRQLQGDNLSRHQEYLYGLLSGPLPALNMPSFKERPPVKTSAGKTIRKRFSREQTGRLRQFGTQYDASLFVVLLSMLKTLLYRYTGQQDIIIGISSAGRMQKELESQIGFYINTLVIRTALDHGLPYLELQHRIKNHMLEAIDHQAYPFDRLVDELTIERDTSRSAIFDILVEFQNFENDIARVGDYTEQSDLTIRPFNAGNETSLFDFNFFFALNNDHLECNINYNTDIYDHEQVQAFFHHFQQLVTAILDNPSLSLGQFEYLDPGELAQLDSFNHTETQWQQGTTITNVIYEQATLTPHKTAITDKEGMISYEQLLQSSRQIAQLLFSVDSSPCLVGILMDRSIHYATSILGTWQAGHAYLPFDPANFIDRILEVALDSGIHALVTTRKYLHIAQELQWSCPTLKTILCMDSDDLYAEDEPIRESMNREMWETTGEMAQDDIVGGGWINSYTGLPFSRAEMDEYAENTFSKLSTWLSSSARVLEIGCASGITMFKIAPHVQYYLGVDLSATIIEKNRKIIRENDIDNVDLECLYAHEIDNLSETDFDIIIINSVIQNFNGYNYFRKVISKCIDKLSDKGLIYIGDIMDVDKRAELLADLRRFKADHQGSGYNTLTDFSDHQFYSRQFFSTFQTYETTIQEIKISDKIGTIDNEMTNFRFDAIFFVDKRATPATVAPHKWQFDRRHLALFNTGAEHLPDRSHEDGLAYVIYTSGSTGTPKGVMVLHRGLLNHIQAKVRTLGMDQETKLLQNAAQTFDISIWQYFSALTTGGTTVIYSQEIVLEPEHILSRIAADEISIAEFVPGYLTLLLEEDRPLLPRLPQLKYLLLTGEAVPKNLVKDWLDIYPGIPVVNAYGPTEASDDITHHIMRTMGEGELIPLGKPIQNMKIYIADEGMQLCPVGIKGEICVSGLGVGAGYLHDPIKTGRSFIDNPFMQTEGYERLYKTGDIGRWLPDGTIEFFGRKDQQVKIRGHRIELGEIESKLHNLEGVKMAAVIVKTEDNGNKQLVAYICLKDACTMTAQDIKIDLARILPEYMVPSSIVLLEELPMNANGKIDRNGLPDPDLIEGLANYSAPETDTERRLVAIWEEILHRSPIGTLNDFFEMGGHSLKATRLISRIKKEFAIKIEFRKVFTFPTIKQQARLIEEGENVIYQEILPVPLQTFYKASHAQKRLWVLSRLEMATLAFNLDWAYRFEGELDVSALQRAYQDLVNRHESLRTVFVDIEGEPHQVILPAGDKRFFIGLIDLQDEPDKLKVVEEYKYAEVATPFDMEKGPLIRARVLRTEPAVYFFLLTIHHIIADGWSLEILTRELLQLYEGYKNGDPVILPPLKIQYKDFSGWLQDRLSSPDVNMLRDYWHNKLAGELPVLDLPSARSRPAVQTYNGQQLHFQFSNDTTTGLNELARKNKVSLFIVIMAILKTVFYRYTSQTDIIVGTSTSGRGHKEVESLIGLFLNTIALRTQFNGQDRFVELLDRVKETVLDAFDHQDYPFDLLVEDLAIRRDLSRSPIYDVLVLLQNVDVEKYQTRKGTFKQLKVSQLDNDNIASQGDLLLNFSEDHSILSVTTLYNTDIFAQEDIIRLVAYFEQTATCILSDPAIVLDHIPLVLPKELGLLDTLTGKDRPLPQYPADVLIEQMATSFPSHTAVIDISGSISYERLNGEANRLARTLISLLDGPGEKMVAIVLPRSIRFIRAVLAIWKAGMAYIPLDPEWPAGRIKDIIANAAPRAIIGDAAWLSPLQTDLPDPACILVEEGQLFQESHAYSADPLPVHRNLTDLAYVIYTSGSTGKSKGVMIEHLGMLNHLEAKIDTLQITQDSRVLQNARLTFDISVWQCFAALMKGGTTIVYEDATITDLPHFIGAILADRLSIIEVVPSYLSILLEEYANRAAPWQDLKHLLVTGERVSRELTGKWFTLFPQIPLVNAYGPTEASDDITHHTMLKTPEQDFVPLGQVVQNLRMYIVNKQMQLCPPGFKGEICIAGPGVGRGYLGDKERTDTAFVANPFDPDKYPRLYKTGDLGRWHPDGALEFLGREDHQVKIRGFRIELEEIETRLLRITGIRNAVVRDFADSENIKYLIAFVDAGETSLLTEESVRNALQEDLPDYMIPLHILFLTSMPLTDNGKIDRKKLLLPGQLAGSGNYIAPATDMERMMVNTWHEVLEYPLIGVTQDFFEIGGHSLKAIQVISRMYKTFGIKIDLTNFFLNPTIKKMIKFMQTSDPRKFIPITPVAPAASYPASHAQIRLWLTSQDPTQSIAYNLPSVYRIKGRLDIPSMKAAFIALAERHESLRTVFVMYGDQLHQEIRPARDFGFQLNVLDFKDAGISDAHLRHMIQEEASLPFDLENGPLIRAALLTLDANEYMIMLTMHHIITDGWSFSILVRDLFQFYYMYETGRTSVLPSLPLQYKDYCNWQNTMLANGNIEKARRFWHSQFSLMPPPLNLLYDHQSPEAPTFRAGRTPFRISSEMAGSLRELARKEHITLFALQVALSSILLHKLSGQRDFVIGVPYSGREHPDLENVIGFFVNTLPLRINVDPADSCSAFLKKISICCLDAIQHQAYPFDSIIHDLGLSGSEMPLFNVMIVPDVTDVTVRHSLSGSTADKTSSLQQLEFLSVDSQVNTSKMDLVFHFDDEGDQLFGHIEYREELFDAASMLLMRDKLLSLIREIIKDQHRSIRQLDLLANIERQLEDSNIINDLDF